MPENAQITPRNPPILAQAEVARRMLLLADLQAALAAQGIRSVLARNHRLVLHYNGSPCGPSGLTDPQLHVLTPERTVIATTDGTTYSLASGAECPTDDPAAAATVIRHNRRLLPPRTPVDLVTANAHAHLPAARSAPGRPGTQPGEQHDDDALPTDGRLVTCRATITNSTPNPSQPSSPPASYPPTPPPPPHPMSRHIQLDAPIVPSTVRLCAVAVGP